MMKSDSWTGRTNKNTVNLGGWTLLWVVTLALASFGPIYLWAGNRSITLMAIVGNALIGLGLILSNRRYINGLDELQKKIHLEAMAIALGVGVVGGLTYSLLDTTNLIAQDAEIAAICILISLTYLAGIFYGLRKYA